MNKKGTHGTTRSRLVSIQKEGFNMAKGRAGTGIYFWAGSRYAEKLAIAWYKQHLAEHRFEHDTDPRGVIIYVILNVEEDNFLDLEDPLVKDAISEIAQEQGVGSEASNEDIARLYDVFIKRLEKAEKTIYTVVAVRVAPPKLNYCSDYPIKIIGAPLCYMARARDCVTIADIKEIV